MSLWMKSYGVTIQMNASEQYFPVVLFIMLYKVVLTFESVDEILWCDHSNESYWAVLYCCTVYNAVQGGSNFWVRGWNLMVWPFEWKLLSSTFLWYVLFIMLYKVVLTFETVDEILWSDHLIESYWAVLLCGTVYLTRLSLGISRLEALTFGCVDEILWAACSLC